MKTLAFTIGCFFIIANIGISFPISCPDKESFKDCSCRPLAFGLHVVCSDFNDTQKLVNALRHLNDYKVQNVVLHNLILKEVLPKDLFKGLAISEIAVEKSNLTFSQPAFKGLDETLEILNIRENSIIKSSEKFTIAKLRNLTELNMKKNPLSIVKDDWLNGKIPNVRKIRLEDDKITKIESKAFADLACLQEINLAENSIKEVQRSMFPKPAQNLTVMDLSGNQLHFLPEDFFIDMPVLEEVVLSGNDLQTLPENTWKPVWKQLKVVLLSDNNLICDSSLNWIPKLGWPEQLVGECIAPSELVGKELREVYDILT